MFRSKNVIPYLTFIIYGITVYSCTYDNLENHPCASAPDMISFSIDIVPVLNTNCSTLLCHSGSEPAANLNLEADKAYNSLQKEGSGYINTANPTHSVVYSQLFSSSKPMPPDGKLDPCSTSLILKWLEQGAKNN
ncbi:MAG: hypothetical protein IPP15_05375 [Saprospiraceae bacterium]|uniref:Cytochrome C Planctomycete-type domain-containing protein n=1 Tax=Candidatus Opimibacter skivensis TaxID=2982028 RepID=A0A9D7STN1_9BACT|nr:hypothetical protein [Candidatus Opimibacter skivensis]